uniref:uncharacterized protein LOC122609927 n=1 Tax=Erigeron canadensis TaxID=72917 RepID=UPI001CB8CBA5|nr:uncharacterized protein LOC122609927 [Erigeron canadensis]
MCRRFHFSRLCRLFHHSFRSFTDKSTLSISKAEEKSLLITLSQVFSQIKLWTSDFDSDSDNADHGEPLEDNSTCHLSPSECILDITNTSMFLLAVESRYVQHLVGNVVVSVSEFVVTSGRCWEEFLKSLCFYFEMVMCKVISSSLGTPVRAKCLDTESLDCKLDLRVLLDDAGWNFVGAIVLVLRTILKRLKTEEEEDDDDNDDADDDEIVEVYLKALGSCLQNIPWNLFDGIFIDDNEFSGYFVQLLCSMVSQSSVPETVAIHEIVNIFPKILTWCFVKQGESCSHTRISQYVRHKILVLMSRLSSLVDLDCIMVVSWLQLINNYFHDLLLESVAQLEADQNDCLKDSPFNGTSYRHLQRRAVFLYLKLTFSLIKSKERCKKQCACGDVNSCSKKGFTALYEWIQKQLPANIIVNFELYDGSCKSFTKSFLQLYMHEDDMLFEVLLLLTYIQQIGEDWTSQVVEKDIVFLLLDIFDTVHLFHLFLSELHYDHQVLLDYLISKYTGASCAEYILRCLRIICDQWRSFLEYPHLVEVGSHSSYKRRKVTNDSCIQQELSSVSVCDQFPISSKTNYNNEKTCKQPFHDARDCLLLLKKSIESLHQKDLFPYNPQVLLRRLRRFQELCST